MVQARNPQIAAVLPSVDRVLQTPAVQALAAQYSHTAVVHAVRSLLSEMRQAMLEGAALPAEARQALSLTRHLQARLEAAFQPSLRRVFNLTGTVLHTNLGRALIAEAAVEAAVTAMRNAVSLEFDLSGGRRGERDEHVRELLCELSCWCSQRSRRARR